MTCREFADFMGDYLAGALDSEVHVRFQAHLRSCANCQRYLAGYEQTVKLGKSAFDENDTTAAADMPDDLVKAILAARQR